MLTRSKKIVVVCLWVLSLVAVAAFAKAQTTQTVPLPSPVVVSGGDLGFRIEGTQGTTAVGRLVVRRNGQWVDAGFAPGLPRIVAD
jgi:hypothetical protein